MPDYLEVFSTLLEEYFDHKITRKKLAQQVATEISIDEIPGDKTSLLPNVEHALRHITEPDYETTDAELRYYLDCLRGDRSFCESDRDIAITQVK